MPAYVTDSPLGHKVGAHEAALSWLDGMAWLTAVVATPPGWTDEHQAHADRDQAHGTHGSHHTTGGRVLQGHPARHEGAVGDDEWEHRWASPESGADVPDFVTKGAAVYRAKQGLAEPKQSSHDVVAHKATSQRIAKAYDSMPADDPKAHPAYDALSHEVGKQFHHLTSPVEHGGMGVKVEVVDHDPYPSHHHLVQDLADNHRIKVLSTKSTGPHPRFTNEQNDQFRAVHDVFGHAGTGRPFDRHGEEAAWSEHASMFSPKARAALTTETRGQNASLINNGKFAEQKVGLLPSEFHDDSAVAGVHRRAMAHAAALLQRAIGWLDGRMTSDPALRKVPVPCAP